MTTLDPNPDGRRVTNYREMRGALYHGDLIQGTKEFAPGNITENVVGQLDGEDHKRRRRRENPLFRGAVLEAYETEILPEVIDTLLAPIVARGYGDLVDFGYHASLVVSARAAGVDFDWRDAAQRSALMSLDRKFMQAALLSETKEDLIGQVRAEALEALDVFAADFFDASRRRREALIATAAHDDTVALPQDLLTSLLLHRDELDVDDGTIIRETAYFMESGGNTSVQLLANTLDILLDEDPQRAEYRERATQDLGFTQRCALEAQRLRPRPTIRRRAGRDTEVSGCPVEAGELLVLDIPAANLDLEFWGQDAESFCPERTLPSGAYPAGLSFSGGLHTCIGRTLAVGSVDNRRGGGSAVDQDARAVYGLVPRMVHALLRAGVRRDPKADPSFDLTTYRPGRWAEFPVLFGP